MKIFITGGTGFVGRSLTKELACRGHEVTVLDRTVKARKEFPSTVSFIETDGMVRGPWQDIAAEHEILINLAGASIFSRWNEKKKKEIYNSRILTTRNLVEAISYSKYEYVHLISTSAVGYYGFHEDEELTEESPPGNDFLAVLAQEWEAAAYQAQSYNAHVAICRIGVVLGRRGGALRKMLPIFKTYMGCPLGNGKQWFPWIHEQDLVNIFLFLIDRKDMEGPFNCTAPQPVRNSEMTRAIGEVLEVQTLPLRVPGFMMRLILGELGDVLLKGQKAIPRRLTKSGFRFFFPTVHEALKDLLKKE
ncbi:MAG: TIGR01777 family oxidoreductase [Syntrophaceae bacterium]